MKITDILNSKPVTLSFEVFPPGSHAAFEANTAAASQIAALSPAFLSVTYGAGGGTSEYTLGLAEEIRAKNNVEVLPHLTCVSSDREHVNKMISAFQSKGFENIMALRGDLPKNGCISSDYHFAAELIRDIRSRGEFCIGAACYPEGHPECAHKNDDIRYLKEKVDAGCDFLTTQLFFDNAVLYNFLYRIREAGITLPVLAGIMPITGARYLKRSVAMSGTVVPARFLAIVDRFGDNPAAMKQAGIVYACEQIVDLIANEVNHIHVYTMNKPDVAAGIVRILGEILR